MCVCLEHIPQKEENIGREAEQGKGFDGDEDERQANEWTGTKSSETSRHVFKYKGVSTILHIKFYFVLK